MHQFASLPSLQDTSPECKCRRTPPSSRYLQCRHILNSLRISCETDPTERKACETDTGSTAEPNSDLRGEQLNEIRSNEHRSVAEARAQRGREKTTNRIEARGEMEAQRKQRETERERERERTEKRAL